MSDVRIGINELSSPSKEIGIILMDFYDNMKTLETDEHRGGKQATLIVMTINDIEELNK